MHEGGRNSPSEGVAFPNHLLPPSILREFERAAPGAAERLLQLLEAEQKERHESDAEEQRQRFILQCLALALGFTLSMAGLGVALVVALAGHPWAAGIVSAAVSAFSTHLVRNVVPRTKKTDLYRD